MTSKSKYLALADIDILWAMGLSLDAQRVSAV